MATTFYTVWSRILDSDDMGYAWNKGFRTVEAAKAAIEEDRATIAQEDEVEAPKPLEWGDTLEIEDEAQGFFYQIAPVEIDD